MKKNDFVNLHRHGDNSLFDGFGIAKNVVQYVKEIGQDSIGLTDHGSVSGLIEHYKECKNENIKPIMGCEIYFQIKFNKEIKPYHMCLHIQNKKGWSNLMIILTIANKEYFYYRGIVTLELLERYNEGLICSTACINGFHNRMLLEDKEDRGIAFLRKLKSIFKDRLFLEIMPYKVLSKDDIDIQKKCDKFYIKVCEKLNIDIIITCDSHFARKEDYDTYKIMRKIGKSKYELQYSERFIQDTNRIYFKSNNYYGFDCKEYVLNTKKLSNMVEDFDLDFGNTIPKMTESNNKSKKILKKLCIKGMKIRDIKDEVKDKYLIRLKKEYNVICELNFQDYFLLCYKIIKKVKEMNIAIGNGRGSGSGSLIVYLLGLFNVDPIKLNTIFERFLRLDKKQLPDLDFDISSKRRDELLNEVIDNMFKDRAAQIITYGYYRSLNLINDLCRVLEVEKEDINLFKEAIKVAEESEIDLNNFDELLKHNNVLKELNEEYNDILYHFSKLYNQKRFIGKHAGGIAITNKKICNYTAIIKVHDKFVTAFNLDDLEELGIVKIDLLGLKTVDVIEDLKHDTRDDKDIYEIIKDKKVLESFSQGNTIGIFQFEKKTAQKIFKSLGCNTIEDGNIVNSINRPAPLIMGVHDKVVEAKESGSNKDTLWYKYTKDTYGCIIYQESVMKICRGLAGLEWGQIDKILKWIKKKKLDELHDFKNTFVNNVLKKYDNIDSEEIGNLWDNMSLYIFNKAHAVSYTLIAFQQMYYKINYKAQFWANTLKYEKDEMLREKYKKYAIEDNLLILKPHINCKAVRYKLRKLDGEYVIQEGLGMIKGIGEKTAEKIISLGPFENKAQFINRVDKRSCNKKVMELLESNRCFQFDFKKYMQDVINYNSWYYTREFNR